MTSSAGKSTVVLPGEFAEASVGFRSEWGPLPLVEVLKGFARGKHVLVQSFLPPLLQFLLRPRGRLAWLSPSVLSVAEDYVFSLRCVGIPLRSFSRLYLPCSRRDSAESGHKPGRHLEDSHGLW